MNTKALGGDPTHVVVGAGSAGAVLAARLSEDADKRVLLLEAGKDGNPLSMRMPAGVFGMIGNPALDWSYPGAADPSLDGRALHFPAGRTLGGSSAINGLVYARGDAADYADWVAMGAAGWSWEEVLPFFRRSEDFSGPSSACHGVGGELAVGTSPLHPLADRFLDACGELGIERRADYACGDIDGAFPTQATIRRGHRSGSRAFLDRARGRPNLAIVTGARAETVILEGSAATGVRYRDSGGAMQEVRASAEVIVAAGAFGTPLLLQRSGIGPGALLQRHGIKVAHDVPGIGANLRDHLSNGIAREVDAPTYNDLRNPLRAAMAGLSWLAGGSGPLASASVSAMAYGRSEPALARPDFMLSFLPVNTDWSTGKPRLHPRRGVFVAVNTCRTRATGHVAIGGPSSDDRPDIQYRLLADAQDRATMLAGLRTISRLFTTEIFGPVVSTRQEDKLPSSEQDWEDWLRNRTALGYHSIGTCRMGGPDAPLDPHLRLRDVARLRVADASAMPTLISGNTNAAAVMIGERAAEFIRAER